MFNFNCANFYNSLITSIKFCLSQVTGLLDLITLSALKLLIVKSLNVCHAHLKLTVQIFYVKEKEEQCNNFKAMVSHAHLWWTMPE